MIESEAKELAKMLNALRDKLTSEAGYSKNEIQSFLKTANIPYSDTYISSYVKHGIFVRTRRRYYFPESPIYYGVISKAIDSVRMSLKKYRKNAAAQKVEELVEVPAQPLDKDEEFERECIAYLKSRGFKVMKCVTTWEEI